MEAEERIGVAAARLVHDSGASKDNLAKIEQRGVRVIVV
jgi:hypothetical protein